MQIHVNGVVTISIEAKVSLLNGFERELSSIVTKNDMTRIMSLLSDQLSNFNLVHVNPDNSDQDDLLDAYLSAMKIEGRSMKTVERYRYVLTHMMNAVKIRTRNITIYHLRKYLTDERERGLSERTLEGYRQVFSSYFNWLQRERLIETNPTANLGAIKYPKKIKVIYSEVEIERLKNSCKTKRDYAIVLFLKSTGCRISEMTSLNRSDVDLKTLECTVFGKGAKERTVFLDPVAGAALTEYFAERTDNNEALFIGKGQKRLLPGGVRAMLKNLGAAAHVEHVHPHKFRRTLTTNLIRHGMPIQEAAMILGHDKLDTTMKYVVLDKSDVKHSYKKYA